MPSSTHACTAQYHFHVCPIRRACTPSACMHVHALHPHPCTATTCMHRIFVHALHPHTCTAPSCMHRTLMHALHPHACTPSSCMHSTLMHALHPHAVAQLRIAKQRIAGKLRSSVSSSAAWQEGSMQQFFDKVTGRAESKTDSLVGGGVKCRRYRTS
jgi:hypothetical protein